MVKNLCWFCMPSGAFGHPELHPAPGAICDDIGLVWGGGRDFHLGHEGVHGGTVCRQRCDNQCDQLKKKTRKNPVWVSRPFFGCNISTFQPSPRQLQSGYGLLMFQRAMEGCHILPSRADVHSPHSTEVNDIQFG